MISVVAKLPVQEGKAEEAIEMFKALLKEVATEEGTLLYSLNQSKKDPNTIVIIERYKDDAALAAHSATPHFKASQASWVAYWPANPRSACSTSWISLPNRRHQADHGSRHVSDTTHRPAGSRRDRFGEGATRGVAPANRWITRH